MENKKPVPDRSFQKPDGDPEAPWWQPSLILFVKLSGWIAVPVIMMVFVGKWLDRKYHTAPWFFLLLVAAGFLVSIFGMVRDAMREMKRIEREEQRKKNQDTKRNRQTNSESQITNSK